MKKRNGFVSNSSSSSFIIRADCLRDDNPYDSMEETELEIKFFKEKGYLPKDYQPIIGEKALQEEIEKIREKIEDLDVNYYWDFEYYKGYLLFSTTMDNFDIMEYLETIYGKRKIRKALEIFPHNGYREELGISGLRNMIDKYFYPIGD
jgi:hypothetical protein